MRTRWVDAALLLALAVAPMAGCGEEEPAPASGSGSATDTATDDTATATPDGGSRPDSSTAPSTDSPTGPAYEASVEVEQVAILSASNAGGAVSDDPVELADGSAVDRGAVTDFVAPLGQDLPEQVRAEVRDAQVPADGRLLGAVVAVGCDVPTGVTVSSAGGLLEVQPQLSKSGSQCLVPVTSVAIFVVP